MQRRLLLALVWFGVLLLVGFARIVWSTLVYLMTDVRRFLLAGSIVMAMRTIDLSALSLAPQIEMRLHPVMAALAVAGVLLVFIQGLTCPWWRNLRRRFGGQ
jgi:hypothetical protein